MRYLTIEYGKEKNAGPKARMDIEKILSEKGLAELKIGNRVVSENNTKLIKLKNQFYYKKNAENLESKIENNEVIIYQHPMPGWRYLEKAFLKVKKKKKALIIGVIHDIDSLRYKEISFIEFNLFRSIDTLIVHNQRMKDYLVEKHNFPENKIISLELFDYLINKKIKINYQKNGNLIFAGNLTDKSVFLTELNQYSNLKFDLYGGTPNPLINNFKNVNYKGFFDPNNPPEDKQLSFGLLWDGDSTNHIVGTFGDYLYYINSHKVSLYVSMGLPVIVPVNTGLSDFVERNKIGIIANDFKDIQKKIEMMSNEEYMDMLKNVQKITDKVTTGYFTKKALEKIIG